MEDSSKSDKAKLTYHVASIIDSGDLEEVKSLIEKGGNHDFVHYLYQAASSGHLKIMKYFMTKTTFENWRLDGAMTEAARNSHFDIVDYLFTHGAKNIDQTLIAIANFDRKIVEYILNLGPSQEGITEAMRETEDEEIFLLLLNSSKTNKNSKEMKTFADEALCHFHWVHFRQLLSSGYLMWN